VHFDIKPQIITLQNNFFLTSFKHEDLNVQRFWQLQEACACIGPRTNSREQERRSCQVDLLSDPTDANSMKVKFAFKILESGTETASEIIQWFQNVDRAFTGLNSNNGLLRSQMIQQFVCGSALSGFNAVAL